MSNVQVQKQIQIKVMWTGKQWDLEHAIDFWRNGSWTQEFAAKWLGITNQQLYDFATELCPTCNGNGKRWREPREEDISPLTKGQRNTDPNPRAT